MTSDRETTLRGAPGRHRGEQDSPPRPGVALVDPNAGRRERIRQRLGDRFRILTFGTPTAAVSAVDASIAVLLTFCSFEEEDLARLIATTRRVSPHAEIGIMARDSADLIDVDVARDEELISPVSWSEFVEVIDGMVRRARYSATLQRYFKATLAANDRRIAVGDDPAEDDEYRHLEAKIERLQDRLDELTAAMNSNDYAAMLQRLNRGEEADREDSPRSKPAIFGLPDACPACDLEWGTWHGPRLGYGYEGIAAFVWRCTNCNHVISNPDPNFRHVARR